MVSLKEWFINRDKDLPIPKFVCGDRVFARDKKFPLVGYVIRESVEGMVMIHSDLPISRGKGIESIISVPRKNVKKLKEL